MKLIIQIDLEYGETKPLKTIKIENKFIPSDVEKELIELCKPFLFNLAGTDGRILLKGDINVKEKGHKVSVALEFAQGSKPDPEKVWIAQIRSFVRCFRNWIFEELNPVFEKEIPY